MECRHFNGYKPCLKNPVCDSNCPSYDKIDKAILIIHLGAMGSVVRSTALLRRIKAENPKSYIIWLTEKPSDQILKFHPAIDRVFEFNLEAFLSLQSFNFDTVYALDKDLKTAGLLSSLKYRKIKGFAAHPLNGSIIPIDSDANELWNLGLSNQKKFFENTKTEIELLFETCGWTFDKEKYWLGLSDLEQEEVTRRRSQWLKSKKSLVGINTGCGQVITYKKMSIDVHMQLIQKIERYLPNVQIVLLGGKDESEINSLIAKQHRNCIESSTDKGVRDGLVSIAAVDCLISGDSFAMHAGIAFEKYVLAWFGPTCAHEVDFYGHGAAIKSDFSCSPCWKRECRQQKMCHDDVDTDQFIKYLLNYFLVDQPVMAIQRKEQSVKDSESLTL